jgi:HK97 gp10 family phage protein
MADAMIRWTVDTSQVEGYLPAKGNAVVAALMQRVTQVNSRLAEKIVGKLSGDLLKAHTGNLRDSVRVIETRNDGAKISGGVQAGGKNEGPSGPPFYAKFLEFGSAPHVIMPKDPKRALAFMIDGQMAFRKRVQHPGTRAYHFMSGTLADEKENIIRSMQAAVQDAVK